MPWAQFMSIGWHPSDQQMIRDQVPSKAEFCNAIFDVEVSGYMTKRKWDKFAGLINEAFSLVNYEGTFNITVQLNAVTYQDWGGLENRLRRLKMIHSYMPPCPAFPGWTIVVQFKKFPYSNQLEKAMASVERAIYGVRYRELSLQNTPIEETY